MNAEDIVALCESMSLKELDGPVRRLGGASGDCDGKFLKVCVTINVERPLRQILRVNVLRDGEESVMLLIYERLPNHCYRCGKLRHRTIECTTADGNNELLFGAWLKPVVLIVRPSKIAPVLPSRSNLKFVGNASDGQEKVLGHTQPGCSTGLEKVAVVAEVTSGSDEVIPDMVMEGVGKGTEKMEVIKIVDSSVIHYDSYIERGLSVIDGNQKTTENEDIFQFSSQRSKKQVLGKIFGDSKGIGDCKDGFDSGDSGPGLRRTTELCVVENRKPKCQDGLLLSEKVSGPVLSESLVERLPSKLSHKTSRWKRFDHKQMAISTGYEKGIELGKRGLVSNDIDRKNSKKKPKRTHQRPSDGLIEVEVVRNYNSI
ncbi:hypothetical protein Q3G72_010545 [Acer saccharum]|nr:hypothetical protein Q3G72_010545 [Acer saccharum]